MECLVYKVSLLLIMGRSFVEYPDKDMAVFFELVQVFVTYARLNMNGADW